MQIKFNKITLDIDFNLETALEYFEAQLPIFEGMSNYLRKYFDIPRSDLKHMIMYSAYTWQKNFDANFSLYENALIQEKLILADQFRDEVLINLEPFLTNSNDYEPFKSTIEKALLHYMKEYI